MARKWKSYLGGHSVVRLKKSSGEVFPAKKITKEKIKVNGKKDARKKYFNLLVDSIINDCSNIPDVPRYIKVKIRYRSLSSLYNVRFAIKCKDKKEINAWFKLW